MYLSTNASSLHFVLQDDFVNIYHIYIKYSMTKVATEYPNEVNYDYVFTLPNNRTLEKDQPRDLKNTAFIPSNMTKGNGTYYIAVKLIGSWRFFLYLILF